MDSNNFSPTEVKQLKALSDPVRMQILHALETPRTVTQIADHLGVTRKPLYYHVKKLMDAGLIKKVGTRQVNNLREDVFKKTDDLKSPITAGNKDNGPIPRDVFLIEELGKEFRMAKRSDSKPIAMVSQKTLMIKKEKLRKTIREIIRLSVEFWDKCAELSDGESEDSKSLEITVALIEK